MFLRCASSATRLAFRSFVAHSVEFTPHFVAQTRVVFACSVILDVLNPKMFVKTCVFRHSFSCHFFFCVVFKELFASAFSRITSPFLETFVRVDVLRVPRFSSSRLPLRKNSFANASAFAAAKNKMVGLGRLELLTSRLSGVRSNQLSYRPM